jgi:membrane-anchored protein YejM (alkaline phosphatase superfamily)
LVRLAVAVFGDPPFAIYHPSRISPGVVERITSHVDILPTILDILNRPYDPRRFQGESALGEAAYRYTFMYTPKSDFIATVDNVGGKIIASARTSKCEVYELKSDPGEKNSRACEPGDPQLQALGAFRRMQPLALRALQQTCTRTG